MLALLGDIVFEALPVVGNEASYGVEFAEQAVIQGKPRLQRMGEKLDELRLRMAFHWMYSNPETELERLRRALSAQQARSLVYGNGSYKGMFVLTGIEVTTRLTDEVGTLLSLECAVSLREFVGDAKTSLPAPAVQPAVPPAGTKALPVNLQTTPKLLSGGSAILNGIRQAVTFASQAKAGLQFLSDATRFAQSLRTNPIAALSRAPGLLSSLQQVAGPLAKLSPIAADLLDDVPAAIDILQASNTALGAVRNAQVMLSGMTIANVVDQIDAARTVVDGALGAMTAVSPSLSRLVGQVATRRI